MKKNLQLWMLTLKFRCLPSKFSVDQYWVYIEVCRQHWVSIESCWISDECDHKYSMLS